MRVFVRKLDSEQSLQSGRRERTLGIVAPKFWGNQRLQQNEPRKTAKCEKPDRRLRRERPKTKQEKPCRIP